MENVKIEDLLQGAATTIKDVKYLTAKEYIEPFIDAVTDKTVKLTCAASTPKQVTLVDGTEVTVYNRVHIAATLNDEYDTDEFRTIIGMIYGLDLRKPVIKLYKAYVNKETGHLFTFNEANIDVQDLEDQKLPKYDVLTEFMNNEDEISAYIENLRMNKLSADPEVVNPLFGKWLRNTMTCSWNQGYGPIKLAISTITDAMKDLFINEKSKDYIDESDETTMMTVVNKFAEIISTDSKDICNKVEKTLLLNEILGI